MTDTNDAPRWLARHPLLALWLLGVAVRIPVALATKVPGIDEAILFGYGSSWLRTGIYDGVRWPVAYPLVIGALGMILGARLAIELVYILVGSLAVIPLFLGMERLRGRVPAAWGAAGVALLPAVGAVVNKSGSHSLYLPLLGLAFLLQVRALEDPRASRLLALGAALGAAYVTRVDGLVVLAVIAASMAWLVRGALQGARATLLVVVGSLVFVVPNVVHLHHYTGRWGFSGAVSGVIEKPFYIQGLGDEALVEMTREFREAPGSPYVKLVTHPRYTARKLGYNLRLFLRTVGDIYVFPAVFFVFLGLAATSFVAEWRRGFELLVAWACPTLAFLALNVEPRYFCPMAMFLMLFAGEGWARLSSICGERRAILRGTAALAAAFLLLCNVMVVVASRGTEERDVERRAEVTLREVGDRLGETFIVNPHVRLAIDGRLGAPRSAPTRDECCSRIYVVDPASAERERERFETMRHGRSFRDWTADGLEFHEVLH